MAEEITLDSFDSWTGKGSYLQVFEGRYAEAIEAYTKAIQLEPESLPKSYLSRAQCYAMLGNYELALQDCHKALEMKPSHESYSARANIYYKLGQFQKAVDDYDKAIKLNPKNPAAFHRRGSVYKDWGNYKMAIKDYTAEIDCGYDDEVMLASAYFERGYAYKLAGNQVKYIADLRVSARLGLTGAAKILAREGLTV